MWRGFEHERFEYRFEYRIREKNETDLWGSKKNLCHIQLKFSYVLSIVYTVKQSYILTLGNKEAEEVHQYI